MLGHGEAVPARTSPTLLPHPLALCCHYPVSKCRSASIAMTSTVRVNVTEINEVQYFFIYCRLVLLNKHRNNRLWTDSNIQQKLRDKRQIFCMLTSVTQTPVFPIWLKVISFFYHVLLIIEYWVIID